MRPPKAQAPPRKPRLAPLRLRWSQIAIFISLFAGIVLAANAFVCATVGYFARVPGWLVWQWIPAAIALAFVPATILGRHHSGLPLRIVYSFTATWLGLLTYGLVAALACWALDAVTALLVLPLDRRSIALLCFGLGVATTIIGLFNAAWIRVTRVLVKLPHLPDSWKGGTLALVSDIHLGHISGPFFLRRVLAKLRRLQPDLVMVGGDMFDGTTDGLERLVQPWSEYAAPLGIYFVTGNHDEFTDRREYLKLVTGSGIRVLDNERIVVDGLQILGVHDGEAGDPESLRAILRRMAIDRGAPSILLAHQPANLRIVADEGVSLQLSGHTHRGQFWPFTLIVSRVWGRFAYGLNRLDDLQVYTSSGVGTWGPPLRMGTRSEIVIFHLESVSGT
jgi:predicted MPP superfamily phosphohydrolase